MSLCPFNKNSNKNAEEEKSNTASYQLESSKQPKMTREVNLREKIKLNLVDCGYPSSKVEEVLKDLTGIPDTLVDAYYEMVKEKIIARLNEDSDFIITVENGKAKD